jgi:hypothetical protein
VGGHNPAKTNTQIMDDLMRAAYAAENGTNDMEGASSPAAPAKAVPQQPGAFLDEKAYAALARPATPPAPGSPVKPVMRWLDAVKTPTQPNGPEMPPTPDIRESLPVMTAAGGMPPPKRAYFGRDTMTTDTTGTSVRWGS